MCISIGLDVCWISFCKCFLQEVGLLMLLPLVLYFFFVSVYHRIGGSIPGFMVNSLDMSVPNFFQLVIGLRHDYVLENIPL